jgi:hypothetical protein
MINQTLRNRYIKENRLVELLQRLFASDFRIEVGTTTRSIDWRHRSIMCF